MSMAGRRPSALWGEAGIWRQRSGRGVLTKRGGFTVLACCLAPSEVRLSYAGLTDLLTDIETDAFTQVLVRCRALDAALLRGADDDPPDPRSVAAGFLSVLVALSTDERAPAVDDLQWIDEPSRRVIAFAARRCRGRIALLCAERVEGAEEASDGVHLPDPTRSRRMHVGPLSLAALHAIP